MPKRIDHLRWRPRWASHMGCLKGCLEYLTIDVSDGWLYGSTGHAFVINTHEVVCASGPTAWNTEMVLKLARNVGSVIDGVVGLKSKPGFAEKQREAWEATRRAIDEGVPCYGWELDIPEYYVVYGYDDEGYYISGPKCDSGRGPIPWQEVGDSPIGVLEMYTVKRGDPADEVTTVKKALEFALDHSRNSDKWTLPKYKSGLSGYDTWIQALERGTADGFGVAYNATVWSECRRFAVQFLKEAKDRLPDELSRSLDEATDHYKTVAENLARVSELFPFPPETDRIENARRASGLEHLMAARSAEASGLKALERILTEL